MVAFTSAKSRLIMPGVTMMSLMPWTAWRSRSSAALKDSKKLVPRGTRLSSRSLGIAMTVSTVEARRVEPSVREPHLARAFEAEGLGDHGDGERVEFLGQRSDHRGGAGPGAAAHAGGDEDHVRALQQLHNAVGILERRLTPDFGIGARAQTAGDLGAELQFVGHLASGQGLRVGVHREELDALQALRHHARHGVAAAAAHADDFDARPLARFVFDFVFQIVHISVDDAHVRLLTSKSCPASSRCPFETATVV